MHKLILNWLLACTPDESGPEPGTKPEPKAQGNPPGCQPVNVLEFEAKEIPKQHFGRHLSVRLDGEAPVTVTCTLEDAGPVWRQLIPQRSNWRYLDNGQHPGSNWAQPSFDDSGWPVGQAPFSFADNGVTSLAVGATVPPEVIWFRTTFTLDDPEAVVQMRTAARRDDGIVVYINGIEAVRDNVPIEEPAYGNDERTLMSNTVELQPGMLLAGENVIAVELHQASGSGDAGFDLRLAAQFDVEVEPEVLLAEGLEVASEHELPLYGMLADATYTCVARSEACGGETAEISILTGPSPVAMPALALSPGRETQSWGAYTLFNHQRPCADDHHNRLIVVDPEGRPRWSHEIGMASNSTIDIESALIGPDEILWSGGQQPESAPEIVGLDGETRYKATYPGSDQDIYHHDVERLPDGRLIGIIESNVSGETHNWVGFSLLEHDPATSEITWEWRSDMGFQRGQLPPAPVGEYDPYHANALTVVNDEYGEGVYVSLLYTNELIRVDRATGDVMWHIGKGGDFQLVDTEGNPLPEDLWFDHVHGLNLYGDLLYMYDNGWANRQSRAVAIRLNGETMQAELVWAWTEYGWYEPHWGDVDELPSGAALIAMAHAWCHDAGREHPGALVEVEPSTGEVLWRLDFLDNNDSTYRAQRLGGCDIFANSRFCPAVAERVASLSK